MLGKPVIANRLCQAFANLVDHDVEDLLAEAGQKLVSAMKRLCNDEKLREAMGATGLAKVVSRLTLDHMALTLPNELAPSR